ncbi:hypothetical protein MTYP_00973 [Methylophilaceae bacterium]|nr:hypothetical protein MTYP_00973 [Methylophilaceae bacterium]
MPPADTHQRSVSWFTLIGAIAALVHYTAAVGLESVGIPAAWANPSGFLLAFPVSYFGHRHLSFPGRTNSHRQSMPRFFVVAVGGFAANHLLLLMGLQVFSLPFWLLLGIIMLIVAIGTYLLSRYWAFTAR